MLKWEQTSGTEWRAPDGHLGGARIRALTNGYLGKPGTSTFFVYRDGQYLGSESDLEAAKTRAEKRIVSPSHLNDELPGGTPAFLALSNEERSVSRNRASAPPTMEAGVSTVDMTKYNKMDLDELIKAYNESVERALLLGVMRYKQMARFANKELALKYIEHVESSIKAARSAGKATARATPAKPKIEEPTPEPKKRGRPPKPKVEEPEPPAPKKRGRKPLPKPEPKKRGRKPVNKKRGKSRR
jgi:hypothetical protein